MKNTAIKRRQPTQGNLECKKVPRRRVNRRTCCPTAREFPKGWKTHDCSFALYHCCCLL